MSGHGQDENLELAGAGGRRNNPVAATQWEVPSAPESGNAHATYTHVTRSSARVNPGNGSARPGEHGNTANQYEAPREDTNDWPPRRRYTSGESNYSETQSTAASLQSGSTVALEMVSSSGLVSHGSPHLAAPPSSLSDNPNGAGRPKRVSGEDYPFTSGGGGWYADRDPPSKRSKVVRGPSLEQSHVHLSPDLNVRKTDVAAVEPKEVQTAKLTAGGGRSAKLSPNAKTSTALHQPGFKAFKIVDSEDPVLNPQHPAECGKATDDSEWTVGPGHGGW